MPVNHQRPLQTVYALFYEHFLCCVMAMDIRKVLLLLLSVYCSLAYNEGPYDLDMNSVPESRVTVAVCTWSSLYCLNVTGPLGNFEISTGLASSSGVLTLHLGVMGRQYNGTLQAMYWYHQAPRSFILFFSHSFYSFLPLCLRLLTVAY